MQDIIFFQPVLRIRDVYPGSGSLTFSSRIREKTRILEKISPKDIPLGSGI
jgi:hypothetical protein